MTLALLGGGVLQGVMDTVANVYLASSIGLICDALDCTPQDLISIEPRDAGR
ncbi:helix-turn-helix domain-containing protein [Microbacterium sp. NPDC058021]|uniref:helix-turn-helix domain-containing protein n=1 Tax=Microbacterium sp. NPDC058021 TaxID=3346306 RepID=UPI0036DF0DA4